MGNQQESLPIDAKPIPEFSGYFITRDARVFSSKRGNKLKQMKFPYDESCGYRRAAIVNDLGAKKSMLLHRLVALTFLHDSYAEGKEVNHIDGNKLNNHVDNLEWVTRTENLKHAYKLGLISVEGQLNPKNVLDEETVLEIYNRLLLGERVSDLASEFGVGRSTVGSIKTKSSWLSLLQNLPDIESNFKSQQLTENLVEQVCRFLQESKTAPQICKDLGEQVTLHQVYDIKRRRCFKHICEKYLW